MVETGNTKPKQFKRGLLATVRTKLRPFACEMRRQVLNRFWGMDIGEDCMISFSATLDRTNPRGVHIGRSSAVSFGAVVLAHDYTRALSTDTWIGERCQIGAHSMIMPGVTVGDGCIVAPGSVVLKDVPPGTLVAGNPARSIERGIRTGRWGILLPPVEDSSPESTDVQADLKVASVDG
jgi:acetyltransferase-like isoleucine patch superfamily enzyme